MSGVLKTLAASSIAGLCLLSPCLVRAARAVSDEPKWALSEGQLAPDFKLRNVKSGTWKLSEHRGKVVLVDFWATWCGPCRLTMPEVDSLHLQFHADELVVVSVSIDLLTGSTIEKVDRYLAERKFAMPILLGEFKEIGKYILAQSNGREVVIIPNTYIIDRAGVIRFHETGGGPGIGQFLERKIRRLLAAG